MSEYVQEENKMILGLVIGMFVGAFVGVSIMCLFYYTKNQ